MKNFSEITIESLSHDGRGIGRIAGKTVFITGALPGEQVSFQYSKQHSKFAEANVVDIIKPSAERVVPRCEHFTLCGGCSLQHMNADAQIQFKQQILLDQLQHIGGVIPQTLLPPLCGPIWGYRHKARLGVRYVRKKNKLLVGFREKNSRYLADLSKCLILHPAIGEKLLTLSEAITNLAAYEHIPQIEVAVSDDATALIIRHLIALNDDDQKKLSAFAAAENFHIYLQPAGIDSIKLLWPKLPEELLFYTLPAQNLKLWFHPADFTQINPVINQQMITQALTLLQPKKDDRILDLFCGLGNFTLPFAQQSNFITGVEGDDVMVKRSQLNAIRNNLAHAKFYSSNLAGEFQTAPWAQQQYDKIILDPPRCGALEVVAHIPNFKANSILYISCNSATLARDANVLTKQGYTLTHAGVMDMFPHTSHAEAMALFRKDVRM